MSSRAMKTSATIGKKVNFCFFMKKPLFINIIIKNRCILLLPNFVVSYPFSGVAVLRSKLVVGRRQVQSPVQSISILGRSCRSSCSEFSVVFSETRVNTGS